MNLKPFQQNVPPPMNISPADNFLRGLNLLRNGFEMLFIVSIFLIIPLIDFISAIINFIIALTLFLFTPIINLIIIILIFIGFISLIRGFGKISKTSIWNADYYRSTRDWLLALFVLLIIMGLFIIGILILIIIILSTTSAGTSTSPLLVFNRSNLILWTFGIIGIISIIIYLVAYIKLIKSLKFLSKDLQVRKLHSAGNYLFYSLIINIISIILLLILIFISISEIVHLLSSSLTIQSLTAILSIFALPIFLIIISFIFQLIGYHSAYTGINEFKFRYDAYVH